MKVKGGKKPIYTVDELQAVLSRANPRILPLVVIGAFSGVRTQERIRLNWEDMDLRRGTLTVGEEILKDGLQTNNYHGAQSQSVAGTVSRINRSSLPQRR